jgi:hypothetical protein
MRSHAVRFLLLTTVRGCHTLALLRTTNELIQQCFANALCAPITTKVDRTSKDSLRTTNKPSSTSALTLDTFYQLAHVCHYTLTILSYTDYAALCRPIPSTSHHDSIISISSPFAQRTSKRHSDPLRQAWLGPLVRLDQHHEEHIGRTSVPVNPMFQPCGFRTVTNMRSAVCHGST